MNSTTSSRLQRLGFAALALAVLGAMMLPAAPAQAHRKRHPGQNEVCFDTALTTAQRDDCRQRFAAAGTADARDSLRKDFKRKIAIAKATPPPQQPK